MSNGLVIIGIPLMGLAGLIFFLIKYLLPDNIGWFIGGTVLSVLLCILLVFIGIMSLPNSKEVK